MAFIIDSITAKKGGRDWKGPQAGFWILKSLKVQLCHVPECYWLEIMNIPHCFPEECCSQWGGRAVWSRDWCWRSEGWTEMDMDCLHPSWPLVLYEKRKYIHRYKTLICAQHLISKLRTLSLWSDLTEKLGIPRVKKLIYENFLHWNWSILIITLLNMCYQQKPFFDCKGGTKAAMTRHLCLFAQTV